MSRDLCNPPESKVVKQLKNTVKRLGAKVVFVASDDDHMTLRFEKAVREYGAKVFKLNEDNPHLDLCILGKVDHAIVNCVSSFSAFVKRQRDSENKSTDFWNFKPAAKHQEL